MNNLKKKIVLKADEFFQGGIKSSLFEDVMNEIREKESKNILDEAQLKRDRDWSELANKIVG